jgi:hypothetical protein
MYMADVQVRRIAEYRRNPRACVHANVIVRGGQKYFQVPLLNLFFEYIDDGTIGPQIAEPPDNWSPHTNVVPNPAMMDMVVIEDGLYYVSADRRFYRFVSASKVGPEVSEPYWSVDYASIVPNTVRINTQQVTLNDGKKGPMRLITGRCLQRFEDYTGIVRYEQECAFKHRLPINLTHADFENERLTSLPRLPELLRELNCKLNKLKTLPDLPKQLCSLYCDKNQLVSLPPLPSSLETLSCDSNRLTSLPTLPSSLRTLSCGSNPLHTLPDVLPNLYRLHCSKTQLTHLPRLPASLGLLDCSHSLINTLPELPPRLNTVQCNNCNIQCLPTLPPSLSHLDCSHNQIQGGVYIPAGMCYYDCSYNPINAITSIDLSEVSQTPKYPHGCVPDDHRRRLRILMCSNTQLSTLPTLPDSLTHLNCSYTRLCVLPTLPRSLRELRCQHTQLRTIPPLPQSMYYLDCCSTMIRTLPTIPLDPYRFFGSLRCANTRLPPDLMEYVEARDFNCVNYYTYALAHKEKQKADIRDVVSLLIALGKDNGECLTTADGLELPADVVRLIAGFLANSCNQHISRRASLSMIVSRVRADIVSPIVLPETIR